MEGDRRPDILPTYRQSDDEKHVRVLTVLCEWIPPMIVSLVPSKQLLSPKRWASVAKEVLAHTLMERWLDNFCGFI